MLVGVERTPRSVGRCVGVDEVREVVLVMVEVEVVVGR